MWLLWNWASMWLHSSILKSKPPQMRGFSLKDRQSALRTRLQIELPIATSKKRSRRRRWTSLKSLRGSSYSFIIRSFLWCYADVASLVHLMTKVYLYCGRFLKMMDWGDFLIRYIKPEVGRRGHGSQLLMLLRGCVKHFRGGRGGGEGASIRS